MYIPQDSPLVLHLPTSWQPVRSRSLPHMHVQRWDLAQIRTCNRTNRRRKRYHCASDPATDYLSIDISGTTTTFTATRSFVAILTNKPELQKRLQQEVDEAVGDETPRLSDKDKMPYMEAVSFYFISKKSMTKCTCLHQPCPFHPSPCHHLIVLAPSFLPNCAYHGLSLWLLKFWLYLTNINWLKGP